MAALSKIFGVSVVSLAVCTMMCAADAATAARGNARAGSRGVSTARMPTMPTLPIATMGNLTVDMPSKPSAPDVPDVPDTPDQPNNPDVPDTPDNPDVPDVPSPECPDGGVKNSEYTIDMCMNDLLRCINNGGLPNGLNELFDENIRNSIVNNMGLCRAQVDKCIKDVRVDCENIYLSSSDVWIDFNTRKVQPEYYNFVLRKTGLTPNQAENTCLLLDRNTYGKSFAAVSNSDNVTAEYNNKIGAYNQQSANTLVKANPQGLYVNSGDGVDGKRGSYARWDAQTGTCYLRVAAYNKDKHITNSWLFGAVGDDRPAEVWRATGDTFNCNKDLFGFSLMKDTSTVAVVGVGGGALVGAGVGAAVGHGVRSFDCTNEAHLKKLSEGLRQANTVKVLNQFLDEADRLSTSGGSITQSQCRAVLNLYSVYNEYLTAINDCDPSSLYIEEIIEAGLICDDRFKTMDECFSNEAEDNPAFGNCVGKNFSKPQECVEYLVGEYKNGTLKLGVTLSGECVFNPLNKVINGTEIYCLETEQGCIDVEMASTEIRPLGDVFAGLEILKGEKSNMGQSIGIGAAVGAGAGGLATAITAFVERNNINCRVADGLAQIGFGKSHAIDTLRDIYVKWNLKLPETVAPTNTVTSCNAWTDTCALFTDLYDCKNAQIAYKTSAGPVVTVRGACSISGNSCVANKVVAKSFGACE